MQPLARRILVLEDDVALARLLIELLQDEGHRVETALSVAAARAVVSEQRPDLIISDVLVWHPTPTVVPGLIAGDAQFRGIPVLLCTAVGRTEIAALRATAPPHMRILAKPFAIEALLDGVASLLAPAEPNGGYE